MIDQAIREKRVVLTRDAKLLKHEYLLSNQIYRVKSLLKNDQLIEVIISLRTGMGILQLIEEVSNGYLSQFSVVYLLAWFDLPKVMNYAGD